MPVGKSGYHPEHNADDCSTVSARFTFERVLALVL